jgi:hypothetical protein
VVARAVERGDDGRGVGVLAGAGVDFDVDGVLASCFQPDLPCLVTPAFWDASATQLMRQL